MTGGLIVGISCLAEQPGGLDADEEGYNAPRTGDLDAEPGCQVIDAGGGGSRS